MVFRFAIGQPDGPQSCSWRLWPQGDDVYLLQRGSGKIHKFSFHKTGISRWAVIGETGDGSDRAMLKWKRGPIPEAGSGQGRLLISVAFPTNQLSAPHGEDVENVHWIKPAPTGRALMAEVFLTKDIRVAVDRLVGERGDTRLVFCQAMRNGSNICVSVSAFECGAVDLRIPGQPVKSGQVFGDLVFPNTDDEGTGRPVRMLIAMSDRRPPTMWELGGYEARAMLNPPAH